MMFLSFDLPLFPLIPMIIVPLSFILHKNLTSSATKTHKNQPPSPRKLPIIGNLHQLGSKPHRFLQALTQTHGPLVLIQLGSVPVLVASSPESAREILKTHDAVFASRPILKIPDTLTYGSKSIAFSPYGEYWRQVRSIAVLALLSSRRVQSFKKVREEETRFMIDKIGESCGSVFDLGELLNSLTNNVVCRVALGRTYHGTNVNDLLARFAYLLGAFSVGNYIPWMSWVDRLSGLEGRTQKIAKEFDDVLEVALEEHINKKRVVEGENDESHDLIDILLDAQRENTTSFTLHRDIIKAVIMDVFAAGTDTTFAAIEWAISELIKNPKVMKKLQKEIREIAQGKSMISEEDLEKMHYLQAVIKESLRLHTPLPLLIFRETIQDVKLMGYDIKAGTQVFINAWAIGRDPSLWEEAEKFKPERFLNSSVDYKGMNFEFLPFGAGRRGCPGIQFATVIVELVLANLVYRYDFSLPDDVGGEELDMSEGTVSGTVLGTRGVYPSPSPSLLFKSGDYPSPSPSSVNSGIYPVNSDSGIGYPSVMGIFVIPICRVALGKTYHGRKFSYLLERFTYLLGAISVGNYIPWLSWVDRISGLEAETKKVAEEFDEVLEDVLEDRINKKKMVEGDVHGENDESKDLVDILLDAQRDNTTTIVLQRDTMKAAIMDLFAAGTDTSTSIVWAISELIRHPKIMKKLQQEVTEIAQGKPTINEEDLEKMHYLQAVVKESLRLYPPLPLLILRESTQYVKLMGYDIKAGTQVIINAWAIGRDPSLWEESEKFKPERFLNSSVDYKGMNFEFLPFGAGRRGCPGIQFAIVINELALANLVYKYDLALPDDVRGEELDMSEITGLTLHRKSPLRVVASSRF
ncbi:hypothetical protein LXL04_031890 [Taraxacum kok-saghyz]